MGERGGAGISKNFFMILGGSHTLFRDARGVPTDQGMGGRAAGRQGGRAAGRE